MQVKAGQRHQPVTHLDVLVGAGVVVAQLDVQDPENERLDLA